MTSAAIDALVALAHPGGLIHELVQVRDVPGLYAFHGRPEVWQELGLGTPPDDRPLYVGKAERSLRGRDLKTHFGTGRTGSSTVRRALAALLRETLDLHAAPRNIAKPDGSANYALDFDSDTRLTDWMEAKLRLAVWESPAGCLLDAVETEVLAELVPPLNLAKVSTPWSKQVRAARAVMAAESRSPQ